MHNSMYYIFYYYFTPAYFGEISIPRELTPVSLKHNINKKDSYIVIMLIACAGFNSNLHYLNCYYTIIFITICNKQQINIFSIINFN
jgi:hypothetical protein